jgi:hypothetical protein
MSRQLIRMQGDDVSTDVNGLDAYRYVKAEGMYREFKRTQVNERIQ